MDKTEIHHAAEQYVTNHKDGEVRRMYGHHYRSFTDGAKFVYEKLETENAEYIEALRGIKKNLPHLRRLVDSQFADPDECFELFDKIEKMV